jgi:hypothetical protein
MKMTRLHTVFDIMEDEAIAVKSFAQPAAATGRLWNWLVPKNPLIDSVKAHAGSELLAAVEVVLQGERFVSSGVANYSLAPGRLSPKETFASLAPPLSHEVRVTRCHEVQFYSDDASFLAGFTRFVETALAARNAVIVVATESHRNSLLQRLQVHGVDVFGAIEKGAIFRRMWPTRSPHSWSMICLTRFDFSKSRAI